jgi:hypothetical protein
VNTVVFQSYIHTLLGGLRRAEFGDESVVD